ncbi:conserved hypothetical protein [Archaeoglobus fulgidus DSM 4304]|uniref:Uncharacterized protein AF_0562 n=1 Tax=Archaeoglobus fulgidus (strain ATCC 49558 / DSM 4304 / JCM 9628 / NBRC 100126 / VC-16) TaxID=224325 RepID=Y562_ARCFU|nr:RecName: Full=Uncharacterized protein AF_0562 [Archaeoglobus fulgidus DSM 4304]AAB90679.1 conserved hypothetical protein [Archaeoglobus fulgidus DSM 4304]
MRTNLRMAEKGADCLLRLIVYQMFEPARMLLYIFKAKNIAEKPFGESVKSYDFLSPLSPILCKNKLSVLYAHKPLPFKLLNHPPHRRNSYLLPCPPLQPSTFLSEYSPLFLKSITPPLTLRRLQSL